MNAVWIISKCMCARCILYTIWWIHVCIRVLYCFIINLWQAVDRTQLGMGQSGATNLRKKKFIKTDSRIVSYCWFGGSKSKDENEETAKRNKKNETQTKNQFEHLSIQSSFRLRFARFLWHHTPFPLTIFASSSGCDFNSNDKTNRQKKRIYLFCLFIVVAAVHINIQFQIFALSLWLNSMDFVSVIFFFGVKS